MSETRYEWAVRWTTFRHGEPETVTDPVPAYAPDPERYARERADDINRRHADPDYELPSDAIPVRRTITVGAWRKPA